MRLRLTFIFGLGFFLIAVDIMRLSSGLDPHNIQHHRVLWGAIEVAVASLVATLPTFEMQWFEIEEVTTRISGGDEEDILVDEGADMGGILVQT
ncbi:Uu.00g113080.m01.CDS01 [Anthostomella pinea]|uniref:Uu.00g113080.m01.CDS01 n=1 Tax=Anthostomella pinea TaxID=933095 RepID=A0AAI8YGI0_9PEZI|nr:Uu.00g113080.m01.CDS01 [Anthostomella pinea]